MTSAFTSEKLNPEQKAAVRATEGPCLVVAGPGSGKTRTLGAKALHILRLLIWFFLQLHFTTNPASSTIAFWAHIGGFLMGGTMALAVYKYLPKERFYAARKRHYD